MHDALKKYDDFRIVSRDLTDVPGFTLSALLHNEMHFLPPFLDHYRKLGVERFVFVDDRSTDGTAEFLDAQTDVMVLKSNRNFGDNIAAVDAVALGLPHQRMDLVWRMLLVEKYALDQWSLHLDADEFLDLPDGMTIDDLTSRLGRESDRAVMAAMIDMYPATLSDLAGMADDTIIDLHKPWYFDGEGHLRLRKGKAPKMIHPGSRARLLAKHNLNRKSKWLETRLRSLLGLPIARYNAIRKPVFFHAREGMRFDSSHDVSLNYNADILLPLRHYKFNGPIHRRIAIATSSGGYPNGGREYRELSRLLHSMSRTDGDFRYRKSVLYTGFEDFRRTGNALGFD
ncbi:glycosyltransferase family 2 protein [Loktanella sp. 5RATIMAR09]|uniref:glycosyltransferase family 2 protein n=1 Tax=Loktanella sp. 5RATIMAR09 TaxID=1225655 RepID=UPI00155F4083|nr:glycosyltransferase family 2 protein [Loktanella sp. 5RATIMAR09]